jgi:hypothetical protein
LSIYHLASLAVCWQLPASRARLTYGGNTHDFNSIAKTISRVRAEFLGRSLENQVEAWKGTLQYLGLESARLESGI